MTDRFWAFWAVVPARENAVLGTKPLVFSSLRRWGREQAFSCARLRALAPAEEFCPRWPYSMGDKTGRLLEFASCVIRVSLWKRQA